MLCPAGLLVLMCMMAIGWAGDSKGLVQSALILNGKNIFLTIFQSICAAVEAYDGMVWIGTIRK